jgi:predicted peptidase
MGTTRRLFSVLVVVGLVAAACGDGTSTTTAAARSAATAIPPTTSPITTESPAAFNRDSMEPGQQSAYSFVSGSGVEIEYLLYVPQDYDDSRSWPLILSLHGFLGRDQTLDSVRTKNPLEWIDPEAEFPFILIAPKAPDGLWSLYHEPMDELFEVLGESLSINSEALFLTGLSAGAVGVWQWALARPDRFAGIAPIAGGPSMSPDDAIPEDVCRLADVPMWVAHGEADEHLPIESITGVVAALQGCGSTVVHFTVYEDLKHLDSIRTAYAGPDLYEWMLEQVSLSR